MVQVHPDPPKLISSSLRPDSHTDVCFARTRLDLTNFPSTAKPLSGRLGEWLILGAIAQLGERLPCTQEVGGSIPPGSTTDPDMQESTVASRFDDSIEPISDCRFATVRSLTMWIMLTVPVGGNTEAHASCRDRRSGQNVIRLKRIRRIVCHPDQTPWGYMVKR